MPICCIFGCPHFGANGFTTKDLPKCPEKRKLWMEKINAATPADFKLPRRICVCEVHFETKMWQRNSNGVRKLKSNAIPTIFPFQSSEKAQLVYSESLSLSRSGTNCCVSGCTSRKQTQPSLHFFQFPKRDCQTVPVTTLDGEIKFIQRGKLWEEVLRMSKTPSSRMTVCSKHFKPTDFYTRYKRMHLRPTAIPSLNLPEPVHNNQNEGVKFSELSLQEIETLSNQEVLRNCMMKICRNQRTRFMDSVRDNSELEALTNVKTFKTFNCLVKALVKKFNLTQIEDKLLLVLLSLKLNLSARLISFLFQVPLSNCEEIFKEFLDYLSQLLQKQPCQNLVAFDWFTTFSTHKILTALTHEGFLTFLNKSDAEALLKQKVAITLDRNFERIEQTLRKFACLTQETCLKEGNTEKTFQVCLGLVNLNLHRKKNLFLAV